MPRLDGQERFHRHDWVWLHSDWLHHALSHSDAGLIHEWVRHERPFVVARKADTDPVGCLRLGLALPGKKRIGFTVTPDAVARHQGPPDLKSIANTAPPHWRRGLTLLESALERLGLAGGAYGSAAWQFFAQGSGLTYLTDTSDIDLLVHPANWSQAESVLDVLHQHDRLCPTPRLDGEIISPDGVAVAWRELAARPALVLSKGPADVRLLDLAGLIALFERWAA